MIRELMSALPTHQDYMETLNGKVLYIVDWKDDSLWTPPRCAGISSKRGSVAAS